MPTLQTMQPFTLVSTPQGRLLKEIALRISQSVQIQTILDTVVLETRRLLAADRVLVYQFAPDGTEQVAAESVADGWQTVLGQQIGDTYFQQGGRAQYHQGYQYVVEDIYQAGLTECHLQLLETFQVKANLAVPILIGDSLWGLLVVHQCGHSRQWQPDELELIEQLAVCLAIALQQAMTYQQWQQELTARQQMEARMQESEQRYATLVAAAPVGIFRTDAVGDCIYVNDRWCQITGLTAANAVGAGWQQTLHPEDRRRITAEWQQSVQEHRPFQLEYRFQRPDGKVTWVYGQSVAELDAQGLVVGYISTITDISDRKQSEEALQKSEAHQRALMSALPDLIMRINRAGIYLEFVATPNFHVVGNLPDIVGTHVSETLPPDLAQKRLDFIQLALQTNAIQIYEQDLSIDGNTQVEEVRIVPYSQDEVLALVRDISDRKQAELALKQNEAQSQAILAAIPDLMFRVGVDGVYRGYVTYCRQFDVVFQTENPLGRAMADILPPALAERQFYYLQQALQTGELQVYEQQVQVGDRLQDEEVRVVKSGDDEVLFMIRDISERTRLEAERKQAELALQKLVESTAAVTGKDFFSTLAQQLMVALKVQYVIVTKLDGDHHLQTLAFWKDGQSQPEMRFALSDAVWCANAIQQGRFYCPKGLQQHFSAYPLMQFLQADSYLGIPLISTSGQRWGNLCILDSKPMQDVQWAEAFLRIFAMRAAAELERQQATEALERLNQELELRVENRTAALRSSEAKLRVIFNQAAVGMNLARLDGEYLKVNQKLCDMLGYSREELLAKSFLDISHPEDLDKGEAERQLLYAGAIDSFSIEKRYLHKNGSTVWVNLAVSLVRKQSGEPDYSIGVVENISERVRLEAERTQAEAQLQKAYDQLLATNAELAYATQLKNEFLANMSHELRTPLNAVLGMSEGLLEEVYGFLNERQKKAIVTIGQSGGHLLELINDILDLAKIEAGKLELQIATVSIRNLCESSLTFVRQMAQKKQIQLTTWIAPHLNQMPLDDRRMRQALMNLLSNAVKFTPNGGLVSLEVDTDPAQSAICFRVSDTGIGIAQENLGQLFQPFVQIDSSLSREYSGTGLGLALVRRIAEMHGGSVAVVSEVGAGSQFSILLPWLQPVEAIQPPLTVSAVEESARQVQQPCGSTPLILLSEDNEANIETISAYLLAQPYQLIVAKNGLEAVTLAQKYRPHLILMDIQTPGMDGLETTRQIRSDPLLATTPIIALTALAMPEDRDRCLKAGANEYLSKPLSLKRLVLCIQHLLDQSPVGQSL